MSVTSMDHLYVETRSFEKAMAFWGTLGFAVDHTWGEGDHRAGMLRAGKAIVVLAEVGPTHDPQRPTPHLAIRDPEALDEHLAESDAVDVVTPLEETHWGTRWIRVRDPDGNLYSLEVPREDGG
ncbi:MAG: VOC family protein [Planctomycetota bacterium]|jgi:uncharacterized glyoxalase superfamily protein PhnB